MSKEVDICIVLDRSGSMENCRTDAIGAVNSYLRQVRNDQEIAATVSLVTFDSQSIDTIRDRVSGAACPEILADEYQPRASTPLFDAVGHGVHVLDRGPKEVKRKILAVMTDGLENASREYTKETVKALLDRKQNEDGWLVLYLGAGHDSWAQASAIGLRASNVADFDASLMAPTVGAFYKRARRYAMAEEPGEDARSSGFTPAERASMKRS